MSQPVIRSFSDRSSLEVPLAGGKGAALARLTQRGIHVPPGYILFVTSFDFLLKQDDLRGEIERCLDQVDVANPQHIEMCSQNILRLLENVAIPPDWEWEMQRAFDQLGTELVAIRSSAAMEDGVRAAWAGQLESYVNVPRHQLVARVKDCWMSLFSPRALTYRFTQGWMDRSASIAVVMQKMVQSEISGVAFSVHPVMQDVGQLVIEAGYGLGEAIVSGQLTPDTYVVYKKSAEVKEKHISAQDRMMVRGPSGGVLWQDVPAQRRSMAKLSDLDIQRLTELVIKVETYSKMPVDIEWAIEGGELFLLQSRPITTLS